jgi:hypothetical protein
MTPFQLTLLLTRPFVVLTAFMDHLISTTMEAYTGVTPEKYTGVARYILPL